MNNLVYQRLLCLYFLIYKKNSTICLSLFLKNCYTKYLYLEKLTPLSTRTIPKEDTGLTSLADNDAEMMTDEPVLKTQSTETPKDVEAEQNLLQSSFERDRMPREHMERGHVPSDHYMKRIIASEEDDRAIKNNSSIYNDTANNHAADTLLASSKDQEIYETEETPSHGKVSSRQSAGIEPPVSRESSKIPPPVCRQISKKELLSRQSSRTGSAPRRGSASQNSHHGSTWSINQRQADLSLHRGSVLSVTSSMEPAVSGLGLQDPRVKDGPEKVQGWRTCCCVTIITRIFDPYLFR